MRKISSKRIAQIWLHHTGHDTSRGFGTKTREWEMDTVVSLATGKDDQGVLMDFRKARLRTPQTAGQFKSRVITRDEYGWIVADKPIASKGRNEIDILKTAMLQAYDRLADGVSTSPGFDGAPVRKVSVNALREEVKTRGFLATKESGGLTE